MATYGEKFVSELSDATATLVRLTYDEYEPTQLRDVLSALGAKTEIFLKSAVLPRRNPKNTFEWFIEDLANEGIDQPSRDKLHALRKKYNKAKHHPATIIDLLEVLGIIKEATEAIKQIVLKRIGSTGAIVNPHLNRVFWLAVWDHYIHGDSEVHIILPNESEHWLGAPTFDIIYINLAVWDNVKADLALIGLFNDGRGIIPDSQYDAFNSDSDFLDAWVFEGDYRSLITTLAQYELRQDLILGLNRHETSGSMILAYLLASVDVVGSGGIPKDLAAAIQQQATAVYAVPPDYLHAQYFAEGMAEMFLQIDLKEWSRISGPSWVRDAKYNEFASANRAKHPKYQIMIDEEYVVRMLWNDK
ncbi:MAG: hypothetical protein R3C14_16050 [Caldilineaceae bacterium]